MASTASDAGVARGVLHALNDRTVVLALPHSDYQLHLTLPEDVDPGAITTPVGKRIKGTIEAIALRMDEGSGGGKFIEPLYGAPRIVAGVIKAVDVETNQLIIDVATPFHVTPSEGQTAADFEVGQFVSFYVKSGTTFRPAG